MRMLALAVTSTALFLAATSASAQTITFFERSNLSGPSRDASTSVPDVQRLGLRNLAQSLVIRRGTWSVCTARNFSGQCVTLGPGNYPSLARMGMRGRIASARRADSGGPSGPPWSGGPGWDPGWDSPGWGGPHWGRSYVTLFDGFNLGGRRFHVDSTMTNLDWTPWNDRARSMIVQGGRWQLCVDANFRGRCQIFGPGRYDNLGFLSGTLSSLRPVR
ncbi:MAG: beta/gamma crystallin family protein [Proteobacteria bacterium]|nr:beta/gamma crystallin family protein [Pseudomonadota bacterium]